MKTNNDPPLVSIIVPAFNAGRYIDRCVRSICSQTADDFELLIIDNGSADFTLEICRSLALRDSRIKVITEPVKGSGAARNTGLDNASGRYIAFIDADDYIPENYIECLAGLMEDNSLDWAACGMRIIDEYGRRAVQNNISVFSDKLVCYGEEAKSVSMRAVLCGKGRRVLASSCTGMYRRSVIEDCHIRMSEDLEYGEDLIFNYTVAHKISSFGYIPEPMYIYTQNPSSASHRILREDPESCAVSLVRRLDELRGEMGESISDCHIRAVFLQILSLYRRNIMLSGDASLRLRKHRDARQLISKKPFSLYWKKTGLKHAEGAGEKCFLFLLKTRQYKLLDRLWDLAGFGIAGGDAVPDAMTLSLDFKNGGNEIYADENGGLFPMIAVIIPVFNTEKYLQRCVDSVLSQTYRNLEIILVDDGSTDGSSEKCDAYALKDNRVKVIHQANMGLSEARNRGMDAAKAELYVFADSDDEMLSTMIESLWMAMNETCADIAQCGYYEVYDSRDIPLFCSSDPEDICLRTAVSDWRVYRGRDVLAQVCDGYPGSVIQCNKLYKKKIFECLRYPPGKYHEDEFIAHKELAEADIMAVTDSKFYIYYRNPDSITMKQHAIKRYHACEALCDRVVFLKDKGMKKAADRVFLSFMRYIADTLISIDTYPDGNEWKGSIRRIGCRGLILYGLGKSVVTVGGNILGKALSGSRG